MSTKWKHQVLKRKNFAPTFVIILALWISIVLLIFYTNPYSFGILHLFFVLFFFAMFLTSSVLLIHTRRGFLIALGTTLFLFMKLIGTGTPRNFLLLLLLFGLLELYLSYSTRKA